MNEKCPVYELKNWTFRTWQIKLMNWQMDENPMIRVLNN